MDVPESFEQTAERLVQEAIADGEFDRLPGTGKPLPGAGEKDDPLWWVRSWVRRNGPGADAEED